MSAAITSSKSQSLSPWRQREEIRAQTHDPAAQISLPGDMGSKTQKPVSEPGLNSLHDRFRYALSLDRDKPDSKSPADLGSPVSPLRTRPAAATATSSSSSSGSSTAKTGPQASHSGLAPRRSRSGEILLESSENSPTAAAAAADVRNPRPGHRRSGSGPVIYSGASLVSSTASSPVTNVLPAGNICPSGKIGKTGMICRTSARSDVLGSGTGNYGHGSIMRGGGLGIKQGAETGTGNSVDPTVRRVDPEELKRAGNEQYKRGQFAEALRLYDRAIAMCPDSAALRSNRAAALTGIGRLGEAMKECEESVYLDPGYGRAHQRLASLHIRLGHIENARKHLSLVGQQHEPVELQKLHAVERHLGRCEYARKIGDWKSALRESDAAIAAGADSSPMLIALRAEALLRLHQLDEADGAISNAFKLETLCPSCSQTKFFGMLSNSYLYIVRAQIEMALGRFDIAVASAEKSRHIDPGNAVLAMTLKNVISVAKARAQGNELFNSGKFAEACLAYGEGLKLDPSNPVLHCNRAACRSKLSQWEQSVEDCNKALRIQPKYTKALLRRAASNGKLERWAESVRDYEVLRKQLPGDTEVAEALFHAQVALKTSRGEEVSNLKFGGEVEEVTGLEQFQAAIALPGVSVVHFMAALDQHCIQITPFVDALCTRYPSLNFLKVDINGSPDVSVSENVRTVPTFKIYKNGARLKEMICPSQQVLEYSVRHYGL